MNIQSGDRPLVGIVAGDRPGLHRVRVRSRGWLCPAPPQQQQACHNSGLRMAAKIFISYRRDDAAEYAVRVHEQLQRELGKNLVFLDVKSNSAHRARLAGCD